MSFNIDLSDYPGRVVMHCQTQEQATNFLNYLDSLGKNWKNGDSYLTGTNYKEYRERTCYDFNKDVFGSINYFRSYGYEILDCSEFWQEDEIALEDNEVFLDFISYFSIT